MPADEFQGAVVLSAANPWEGVRMADRQLAEQLSQLVPVLYVEPAESILARWRDSGWRGILGKERLRRLGPGLARLSPEALPGVSRRGIRSVNSRLAAWQVWLALRRLRGSVRVTLEANLLSPIMGKCGEVTRAYWAQDDFVGMAPLVAMPVELFANSEKALIGQADVTIAANPVVFESVKVNSRSTHLIPFGCDYDLFSSAASVSPAVDVDLPRPIAIFMGHLGDRIDFELLDRLGQSGRSLLIVGPLHPKADPRQFDRILSYGNVQWVGERPFESLPSYLTHAEVGILPYTRSKFNIGSFPLKVLEYLAAGLPVVATDLPAIRWLNTQHISVENDPDAFVNRVSELLDIGRQRSGDADRQRFAAEHSWAGRAAEFAKVLAVESTKPGPTGPVSPQRDRA